MSILDGLNEEQKNALLCIEGAVLVTAGAGTGKTKLLTHRIAYLIQEKNIDPYNIIAITFTNKAANEMKERVEKLVDGGSRVWISTFHSMCVKMLRRDIELLGGDYNKNFTIYSDTDTEKAIKTILKDLGLKDEVKAYTSHISAMKNANKSIIEYQKEHSWQRDIDTVIRVIKEYEKKKAQSNALDFDDLLYKAYELLVKCPEVLQYYAERFEYVLVDEFQDTNKIQYDITKILASKHKNLFVVGDEDQSIYSWRGADFTNIFNITKEYENSHMFKLQQNYRCTKKILDVANKVIANNTERFDKKLWSDKSGGEAVDFKKYYDEKEEADGVASKIYSLVKNYGYKYSDFAILVRISALTLPFEEKMLTYNIPHKIYGGFKFFERAEIKNILAYLRIFSNPKDEVSLLRIINFPKRGIGDGAISSVREIAEQNNTYLLDAILNLQNYGATSAIIKKFSDFANIYNELKNDFDNLPIDEFTYQLIEKFNILNSYNPSVDEENEKILNIDAFKGNIQDFCKMNPGATLDAYLENVTLISDTDQIGADDNVIISTVHAVKGLEFKVVFVVGMEDGIFPLSRCKDSEKDMEEERRLAYVAFTRAEERLYISACKTRYLYGNRSYMKESKFVEEGEVIQQPPKVNYYKDSEFYNNDSYGYKSNSYGSGKNSYTNGYNNYTSSYNTTGFSGGYNTKNLNTFMPKPNEQSKDSKPKNDISIYKIGQRVEHHKFGEGVIVDLTEQGKLGDIEFSTVGRKTLMMEIANLTILD